jgi:hypothetical protein
MIPGRTFKSNEFTSFNPGQNIMKLINFMMRSPVIKVTIQNLWLQPGDEKNP